MVAVEIASTSADAFKALVAAVAKTVSSVDDPEFPGVSIVALGMLHDISASDDVIRIELIPTYSGCPALEYIGSDVVAAVQALAPGYDVAVAWRRDLPWSTDRLAPGTSTALATEFAVTLRGSDGSLRCPVCGSSDVVERSPIGPTRCRSVSWCEQCRNVIEVMR